MIELKNARDVAIPSYAVAAVTADYIAKPGDLRQL
jgi:hypothetical protein